MREFIKRLFPVLAASGLLGFSVQAYATPVNLLVNGSFETGSTTGWSSSGLPFYITTNEGNGSGGSTIAENGSYFADTWNPDTSTLSQTFSDVLGHTLDITGWYNSNIPNNTCCSHFSMTFDGKSYFSSTTLINTGGWKEAQFTVTATGTDTLTVGAGDYTTGGSGNIAIDNFSVIDTTPTQSSGGSSASAVPAPGSLSLLILSLLGLFAFRLRRSIPGGLRFNLDSGTTA